MRRSRYTCGILRLGKGVNGMAGSSAPFTAFLSHDGSYTSFSFGPYIIRFRTSSNLKRYLDVKVWDAGYLVVDAEYDGVTNPVEEYIDMIPIMNNLYINTDEFINKIERVEIKYE